mgnify:CR=1 FL=1
MPLRFQRDGITYADLSEEEQEQWDAMEWGEDGPTPEKVETAAVNRWLVNIDTVDTALETLLTRWQTVEGGGTAG